MGPGGSAFPDGRCDCKYGARGHNQLTGSSEETGCPELRSIRAVLMAITDEDWRQLVSLTDGGILLG